MTGWAVVTGDGWGPFFHDAGRSEHLAAQYLADLDDGNWDS
eukprot:gene1817-6864_t